MNLRQQYKISLWMVLDSLTHRKPWSTVIPQRVRHWICDRFDQSIGVFDQMEEGYEK